MQKSLIHTTVLTKWPSYLLTLQTEGPFMTCTGSNLVPERDLRMGPNLGMYGHKL